MTVIDKIAEKTLPFIRIFCNERIGYEMERNKLFLLSTVIGTAVSVYGLARLDTQDVKDCYKETKNELYGKMEELNGKMKELNGKMEKMDGKMKELNGKMETGFKVLRDQIEKLTASITPKANLSS